MAETRAVSLHMKKNSIAGSIINISSVAGEAYSQVGLSAYSASKAAVSKPTKALVGELSEFNIRINSILPGTIATNMTSYKVGTPEKRAEFALSIPLKFVADPEDIIGAVVYLASNNASRYVTGSSIIVDGGSSWGGKN